ncbi:metallopeptidase TldD-related protein [Acetatifactor muris]|uniref:Modulator of DNA gyrase n=1 Tax=Acetatifactor muris TaxID=879566 RepID=A0A2K4ZDU6_9FIRM|nr:metallopeptidase TldD-related protein [Acetatifactor muris]MCR2046793.1 metallopeptidase TldD-related protein [Acetatifactor muris]SOY28621.1 Putative modulator of DNA gyrase [Acetatifactor muris]
MIERILSALKRSGVELYQITETREESAELFFIRKSLDMQRRKEIRQAQVVVYKEFTEGENHMLGSASVQIQDSFTGEEMEEMFRDALYAAGFVRNKYYELYAGQKEASAEDNLPDTSLTEMAELFTEALYAEDTETDVFLNSAEVFATKTTCHILNSRGVNVSYRKSRIQGEFVVQCIDGQDVETYQDFAYNDLNTEALRKKVRDTLEMTRARAKAVSAPPAGEYRVMISGPYVKQIFSYYVERSDSYMIYPKYSAFQEGCEVQGEKVEKDRINLTLKALEPYSAEGIPMRDRELIRDGKLKLIHGSNRYAYYLGLEPTGNYRCCKAEAGNVSVEEMKAAPYLEIVNFSDFQMDSFTGHFGGEIRLAFWYDGERKIPVTGGSINGNILEAQKNLLFSREMQTEETFEGPVSVCMEGINVAG